MVGRVQEDTVQYPFLGNLLVETLHARERHGEKRRSVKQPTTVETCSTQFNGLLRRFLQLPNGSRGPSLRPHPLLQNDCPPFEGGLGNYLYILGATKTESHTTVM